MCDFDALLYGEGYSFGSLENYWDYYRAGQEHARPGNDLARRPGPGPLRGRRWLTTTTC